LQPGPGAVKATTGRIDTVQAVAVELSNPDPVNDTGVLTTPFVGVMVIVGTTVKPVGTKSPPGLPVTVTVHVLSAVAVGPTMNVPVPVPALMEHAGEVIRGAPLAPLFDVMLQDVSVTSRPLATIEILSPGEPYEGVSVSDNPTVTEKVPVAVSPKLPVTTTV